MQIFDGGIAYFIKVVGQEFAAQPHSNAFRPLRQQQRKFGRKGDRFLVASVVGKLPVGCLGIEHHIESELGEAGFDVSGGCRTVAREDVSPVALTVDE